MAAPYSLAHRLDPPHPHRRQQHLKDWDVQFPAVVAQAQALPGFKATAEPDNYTQTGYARNAVLGMADKVSWRKSMGLAIVVVVGWLMRNFTYLLAKVCPLHVFEIGYQRHRLR